MDTTLNFAQGLDREDELASFRSQFFKPDDDMIYMDGNSLGRLPIETIQNMERLVKEEWGTRLIRSWGEKWFTSSTKVGDKLAKLIGASEGEVVISDSTTVNLFKLTMAALEMRPTSKKIVTDVFNFPTDLYVLQGCNHLKGDAYQIDLIGESA